MTGDADREYKLEQLRELIEVHGTDLVARVTELTPRTVLEYAGDSARLIPLGKLESAKRTLEGFEHKDRG